MALLERLAPFAPAWTQDHDGDFVDDVLHFGASHALIQSAMAIGFRASVAARRCGAVASCGTDVGAGAAGNRRHDDRAARVDEHPPGVPACNLDYRLGPLRVWLGASEIHHWQHPAQV